MEPLVTSEVNQDGESQIISVKDNPEYNIESEAVTRELPKVPDVQDLSKLFTPKFVAYVTAPDGTQIPFTYKKIDPGSLMQTVGIPNAISMHPVIANNRIQKQAEELGVGLTEDGELDLENIDEDDPRSEAIKVMMTGDEMQSMLKFSEHCQREVLKMCVITPKIDDTLYDELADEVKTGLYEVITGGVVGDNELAKGFR